MLPGRDVTNRPISGPVLIMLINMGHRSTLVPATRKSRHPLSRCGRLGSGLARQSGNCKRHRGYLLLDPYCTLTPFAGAMAITPEMSAVVADCLKRAGLAQESIVVKEVTCTTMLAFRVIGPWPQLDWSRVARMPSPGP